MIGIIAARRCVLALAVLAAASSPRIARADWRVMGQIGGPTSAVALQASLAYVAVGFRVHVYDVSESAAPREIGSTPAFGSIRRHRSDRGWGLVLAIQHRQQRRA
jgi:hypothetical protein